MAQEISGFGTVVTIVASTTFPVGFQVTQFSDDADPLDFASVKIGDATMGLNGDLIKWAKAVPRPMVLNVIPGGTDDINLATLAAANAPVKGKALISDSITATVVYPDGTFITLTDGVITDAPFGRSISSAGRQKTRSYAFSFAATIGN